MEKLIVILWILFGIYILVLVMILTDLWSGVTKARKAGVIRSSYGFRRTIEKMGRYYNVLFALTIMDAMQVGSLWYFEIYYQKVVPMFPFVTLVGAIGICLIEVKSIYEKAEDKVRFDDVGQLVGKMLVNKDDLSEVVKSMSEYMKSEPGKTKITITSETKEAKKEQEITNN